jgi:hypothetical protein
MKAMLSLFNRFQARQKNIESDFGPQHLLRPGYTCIAKEACLIDWFDDTDEIPNSVYLFANRDVEDALEHPSAHPKTLFLITRSLCPSVCI